MYDPLLAAEQRRVKNSLSSVLGAKATTQSRRAQRGGALSAAHQRHLAKHGERHSEAHVAVMRRLLRRGATFEAAHAQAMSVAGP